MRFFTVVDFQYWILAVSLGLLGLILVYIAWGSYPLYREKKSEEELEELVGHEIKTGHRVGEAPIAPFLIFIYIGIALWAVAYAILVGLVGGTAW